MEFRSLPVGLDLYRFSIGASLVSALMAWVGLPLAVVAGALSLLIQLAALALVAMGERGLRWRFVTTTGLGLLALGLMARAPVLAGLALLGAIAMRHRFWVAVAESLSRPRAAHHLHTALVFAVAGVSVVAFLLPTHVVAAQFIVLAVLVAWSGAYGLALQELRSKC